MAVVYTLKKTGEAEKTIVKETTYEIWEKMTGEYDPNMKIYPQNRDFILLTDLKDNCIIFSKKFIWKIEE